MNTYLPLVLFLLAGAAMTACAWYFTASGASRLSGQIDKLKSLVSRAGEHVDSRVDSIERRIAVGDRPTGPLASLYSRYDETEKRFEELSLRFRALEARSDYSLKLADERLAAVKDFQQSLDKRLEEIASYEGDVAELSRKVEVFSDALTRFFSSSSTTSETPEVES